MAIKLFKKANEYYQWCYEHGVSKGRYGLEFTNDIKIRQKIFKKLHQDIFVNRGVRLSRDTIPNFPESEIIAECYNMDDSDVKKINDYHKEMEDELKKLYSIIKRDKASELTAILRARQKIELVKVPLFIDMIEEGLETGMSVVVFLNFTDTIQSLSKRLNINCIFDGILSDKIRQKNVDDFQEGKQKVILVNIQSGGSGLNLHDIYGLNPRLALISPNYSAILMRQSTGRVWRENSKSKSIQKIVFVSGTVEEKVCERVREMLIKYKSLSTLSDPATRMKTVVVRCGDHWIDEFRIDSFVFEDIYMEAATRAVEKRKNLPGFKVVAIVECWIKEDDSDLNKHICYNTYYIMVNAGLYEKAENLRANFLKLYNIDLKKESLNSTQNNNGTKFTTNSIRKRE
jgi:hypothetical protein